MQNKYLVNNRMIFVRDYMIAFGLSEPTARKRLRLDVEEYKVKRFTYTTFFRIYEFFPDPSFIPAWASLPSSSEAFPAHSGAKKQKIG